MEIALDWHQREELEYNFPEDEGPYKATARSRFDSHEFYAVFQSSLRALKLFQSFERPGFLKYLKAIAAATSDEW